MPLENYDRHGLELRSCGGMMTPHAAHTWTHTELGSVRCWGRNKVPADAVEKYTTEGCTCEFCVLIREGLWPTLIMCEQKWEKLPIAARVEIAESIDG